MDDYVKVCHHCLLIKFYSESDEICQKHPAAKPYTHKGFALYDIIAPLMPGLVAAWGTNIYCPSEGTHGAASSSLFHQP